ncbi:MAG: helix-turn-helix domain-containing protein [Acidobacteriota bacterium]
MLVGRGSLNREVAHGLATFLLDVSQAQILVDAQGFPVLVATDELDLRIRDAVSSVFGRETLESAMESDDERIQLIKTLERNRWNKARTARELKITVQGLWKRMKRLGVRNPD